MVRPSEVVGTQARLCESMTVHSYQESASLCLFIGLSFTMEGQVPEDHLPRDAYLRLLDTERRRLGAAYAYHVSEEMSGLVNAASTQLTSKDTYTLSFPPEEVPTELGFVYLDDPMPVGVQFYLEGSGDPLMGEVRKLAQGPPIVAFSWGPEVQQDGSPGLGFTFYAESPLTKVWARELMGTLNVVNMRELDETIATIREDTRVAEARLVQSGEMEDAELRSQFEEHHVELANLERRVAALLKDREQMEQQAGNISASIDALPSNQLLPVYHFVTARESQNVYRVAPGPGDVASAQLRQALLTFAWVFFNFCRQTITTVAREDLDRKVAKRWRKMKIPPMVTVVRLRRSVAGPERVGEGNVQWSHRWIVRGHWRQQACGPNLSERRSIWIHPFVKGPDGAPLHVSTKVYDLSR